MLLYVCSCGCAAARAITGLQGRVLQGASPSPPHPHPRAARPRRGRGGRAGGGAPPRCSPPEPAVARAKPILRRRKGGTTVRYGVGDPEVGALLEAARRIF